MHLCMEDILVEFVFNLCYYIKYNLYTGGGIIMLQLLSLFSGIGAFEKALENLNVKYNLVNYCEINMPVLHIQKFIMYPKIKIYGILLK